ncbi:MAG: nicotinate (nicotinamide) nucleotide adenylyltransferase [Spirochaetes bacterium]|nr:nicotinate (nicotinamide) nucleotide adenylyltransferase [Spirochaetota bacterium]
MPVRMRKFGIFGGTFNPIHTGHLRLAEDVREEYSLDTILFIPANLPPHKRAPEGLDPSHRLEMVRLAIKNNPCFRCDGIELKRGGVSYTIDTVRYLYDRYTFEERPYLIIGSDLTDTLHTWKEIETLLRLVRIIVLMRAGHDLAGRSTLSPGKEGSGWFSYKRRTIDITSSEVRGRIREGRSVRYLVPDGVLKYIKKNGLYRAGKETAGPEDEGDATPR